MNKNKCMQIGLLFIVISMLTGCGNAVGEKEIIQSVVETESTETGEEETAPANEFGEFEAYDLEMEVINQDILSSSDLTMINIWGTFCGPCINEMQYLGEISREYKEKGFQVIGIVIDAYEGEDATVKKAKEIIEKTKADYLHLLPSDDLGNIYLNSVQSIPETLFVDKDGNILKSIVGSKNKEEWTKIIDEILETVQSEK